MPEFAGWFDRIRDLVKFVSKPEVWGFVKTTAEKYGLDWETANKAIGLKCTQRWRPGWLKCMKFIDRHYGVIHIAMHEIVQSKFFRKVNTKKTVYTDLEKRATTIFQWMKDSRLFWLMRGLWMECLKVESEAVK